MKPESIALATAAKSAEAICKRYESSNLGRGLEETESPEMKESKNKKQASIIGAYSETTVFLEASNIFLIG